MSINRLLSKHIYLHEYKKYNLIELSKIIEIKIQYIYI